MDFKKLLPIGSVVLLKSGRKKLVVMGILQVKVDPDGTVAGYDYLGVPYPEGYVGLKSGLLFNHADIQETIFTGYQSAEREMFVEGIRQFLNQTDAAVNAASC